jgi:hypothetical protein
MNPNKFIKGSKVRHPKCPDWGVGEVLSEEKSNKLEVLFENAGIKVISLLHINLEPFIPGAAPTYGSPLIRNLKMTRLSKCRLPDPFKEEYVHSLNPGLGGLFREGSLVQEWRDMFPDIFDDDDMEYALSPSGSGVRNLNRWLAAVLFKKQFQCEVLLGSCFLSSHKEKQRKLRLMLNISEHNQLQLWNQDRQPREFPDLLVNLPGIQHRFFVSVGDTGEKPDSPLIKGFSDLHQLTQWPFIRLTFQKNTEVF